MSEIDVSVVLAVKNEQRFIESALQSVTAQGDVRTEIIVVDDHSTDETVNIVQRLAQQFDNIHLYANPNTGKCAAFNFGVAKARGACVCIFAGDDLMPMGSLRHRWADVNECAKDLAVVGLCRIKTISEDKRYDGHVVPRQHGRGALSGLSYMMNARAAVRLFPVPEQLPNEDTWLETAVTLLPGLLIVHSDVIGCEWRHHAGNSINTRMAFEEFNRRLTLRMRALTLFQERHGQELTAEAKAQLAGLIECESCRAAGNLIGVLRSRVPIVAKARALFLANRHLYGLRDRLYGLLSGW